MSKQIYSVQGKVAVYDQNGFLIDIFTVNRSVRGTTPQEAKTIVLDEFKRSLTEQYGRGLTTKATSAVVVKPDNGQLSLF